MNALLRRDAMPTALLCAFLLAAVAAFMFGGIPDIVMDVMIGGGLVLLSVFSLMRRDARS